MVMMGDQLSLSHWKRLYRIKIIIKSAKAASYNSARIILHARQKNKIVLIVIQNNQHNEMLKTHKNWRLVKKEKEQWMVIMEPARGDGWYTTYIWETLIYNNIIQVYYRVGTGFCSHCALRSHVGEPAKKKKTKNSGAKPVFL